MTKKKIEDYCQLQPLRRDFCPRSSHPLTLVQLAPTSFQLVHDTSKYQTLTDVCAI